MMSETRRVKNTVWYADDGLQFKAQCVGKDVVLWANINGYDIVKPMLIWDFNNYLEDYDIKLKLNYSWNEHVGFQVEKDELMLLIGLIKFFFNEKDASSMTLSEQFPDWESEM